MVMKKTALFFALLGVSLPALLLTPAAAHSLGECKEKYEEKYDSKSGTYKYKYEYKCPKHKYKGHKHKYNEAHRRGYKKLYHYSGGPPPWAPAHGYRRQIADIEGGTCDRGLMSSEILGGAVGGALGGYLGSRVGKGSGQLAATAAGALLGALVGSSIGRSMDAADQLCVGKTLEAAPDNQAIAWRNPDANAVYTVTPVRTFEDYSGRYCREYTTEAVVGGRTEQVYGTACRQPDGSWQLVS